MAEPYRPGPGYRPPTSPPGWRVDPTTRTTQQNHGGVDWGAPAGTVVRAASDGEVWFSGWVTGYGNTVIIRHGFNPLSGAHTFSLYAHLSDNDLMRAGTASEPVIVEPGTVIGRIGNQAETADRGARWTNPHLHHEVFVAFQDAMPTFGNHPYAGVPSGVGINVTPHSQNPSIRYNPLTFTDYPSGNSYHGPLLPDGPGTPLPRPRPDGYCQGAAVAGDAERTNVARA
jgi:murein DD-endopeptidase MepM/ murein hydrolase activator NlpD